MEHFIKGIPLGVYPVLPPESRLIFRAPPDRLQQDGVHLIALDKAEESNGQGNYSLTFATWVRDPSYRQEVKGTWFLQNLPITGNQIRKLYKCFVREVYYAHS